MAAGDIQLVCFDIGGVLVRLADSWQDACKRAGVEASPTQGGWETGRLKDFVFEYETGNLDDQAFIKAVCNHGGDLSHDDAWAVIDSWLAGMYDGVTNMLDRVEASGIATACLSNTNPRHWAAMMSKPQYAELGHLRHRFASHETGIRKPSPDAYRHVETTLGIPAISIIFFDDRIENIQEAQRCGWHARLIDPHGDPISQALDHLAKRGVV